MRDLIDLVENAVSGDSFDMWFQGSKIVDDAGEPLLVYHGTKHDFEKFQPNGLGLIFFTPHQGTARQFSLVDDPAAKFGFRSHRVYSAYLHAINPFDFRSDAQREKLFANIDYEAAIEQDYERSTSHFKTRLEPQHVRNLITQGSWSALELPAVLGAIRKLGHDALYLTEFGMPTIAVFSDDQVWIVE